MTLKQARLTAKLVPAGLFVGAYITGFLMSAESSLWWLWTLLGGLVGLISGAAIPTAYARLYRREES